MDIPIFAMVFVIGAAYVVHPLLLGIRPGLADPMPRGSQDRRDELLQEKEEIIEAIHDLDFEYAAGKLSEQDHGELRRRYRLSALEILGRMNVGAPAGLPPGDPPLGSTASALAAFCRRCGASVEVPDRFCGACGSPIHPIPVTTASHEPGGSP